MGKHFLSEKEVEKLISSCSDYLSENACDLVDEESVAKLSRTVTVLKANRENLSSEHLVQLCILGSQLNRIYGTCRLVSRINNHNSQGLGFNDICLTYDNNPDISHAFADISLSVLLDDTYMASRINKVGEISRRRIDTTTLEDKVSYLLYAIMEADIEIFDYVMLHPEMKDIARRKIQSRLTQSISMGKVETESLSLEEVKKLSLSLNEKKCKKEEKQ